MTFETVSAQSQPFLHVTLSATMEPGDIPRVMEEGFGAIGAFIEREGIRPAGPAVAVYRDWDGKRMSIDIGFPVDPSNVSNASGEVHLGKTPSGHALKSVHHGAYDNLKDTYVAMEAYIAEAGLKAKGTAWEVYVTDPVQTPVSDYLTEVYMLLD